MAKVKFSKDAITYALGNNGHVFGGTQGSISSVGIGGNNTDADLTNPVPNSANRLVLYKGAVPTLAEIKAMGAPNINTSQAIIRSSDQLVRIPFTALAVIPTLNYFSFKESPYANALASGVATWFALLNWNTTYNYTFIVGDVSDMNGNGMLKLDDVNIVAGNRYNVKPLKLIFPYEINY